MVSFRDLLGPRRFLSHSRRGLKFAATTTEHLHNLDNGLITET